MANIVKLKRSAVASAVPTTAQLQLGELAMNTYDGKLFLKKNNGTESIVEIGGGGGGASVTISTTAPSSPSAGDLWWNSEEGKLKIYYTDANTSQWVDSFVGTVGATGATGPAGVGVPTGGTTGQALVKVSGTNYDTTWSTISANPAGSNTEIQFNNSGAFGSSPNLTYDTSTNRLKLAGTDAELLMTGITNEPANPSAGEMLFYAKSHAGRVMPKFRGATGLDTTIQPNIFGNKVVWWNAQGNTASTPVLIGTNIFTTMGSLTARVVTTTNLFARTRRVGYVSSSTVNSVCGHYSSYAQNTIGDGSGLGGFYYVCRFGASDASPDASAKQFVGFSSSVAIQGSVEPSTVTNCIGIGANSTDTNLQIYYGGIAAQTRIDLGSNFPKSTASVDMYELVLFAPTDSNNIVHYRVTRLNTNHVATGTLTGTAGVALPASTTLLAHRAWRSNGTAVAVGLDIVSIYIETDY